MANETIGFIGIGKMGWPMAANLVRAGYRLIPWDLNAEQRARFSREHGTANPATAGELAVADVIITMLPTGADVHRALTDGASASLADSLRSGSVVIDMSSSEPVGTRELGAVLSKRYIALIDAPVSGGVQGALGGTLSIMIGGDDERALALAEPVLKVMGKRLFRTGGLGFGHAMKALNNLVSATQFAVAAEALIIGQRFGLDPKVMADIMSVSTGRSFAVEIPIREHVLTGKFATGFSVGLQAKDVAIATGLAQAVGTDAPIGRVVSALLVAARDAIGPDADHTLAFTSWQKARG
jgi:3-hydroxyisobutyrate dehydrogenase